VKKSALVLYFSIIVFIFASCSEKKDYAYLDISPDELTGQFINYHEKAGKTDIRNMTFPPYLKVITNWGTKPEWLNNTEFLFVSNQMGNIYQMNLISKKIKNITGHFEHGGFTRVHVLKNKDLIIVGHLEGAPPPLDPLNEYDKGQFNGRMYLLKYPYNSTPYLLNSSAWEGIAAAKNSMRIAWSETSVPFYGSNLLITGWYYFMSPSSIWTGIVSYDNNVVPYIKSKEKVISKWQVGPTELEVQNFSGENEDHLTISAYGPKGNGADMIILNLVTKKHERHYAIKGFHYEEWEGIHPDRNLSFVEIDKTNKLAPEHVNLYLYDINKQSIIKTVTSYSKEGTGFYLHEPVFSEDGKKILLTTGDNICRKGFPGYGIGIIMMDYEKFLSTK